MAKILSRHSTSEGTVVWSRCDCGRLHMVLVPYDTARRPLTAGTCPACAAG
ncbi:hypothetical protein [Actinomadura flavalba]|uniref:hypothetical protein n=1 Tax=Actinomadura flavalba TaxID=1120938 RepID=UPI0003A2010F|nr:hypothetical protein [Actinomadura flavalba]